MGVASAPALAPADSADLVTLADAALYEAKRSGRNRVWPPLSSGAGNDTGEDHAAGGRLIVA